MKEPEELHQITDALAKCWNEYDDLSFGEMIDNIFSLTKGHNQTAFWNMETDECLAAINEYRKKRRLERERGYLE